MLVGTTIALSAASQPRHVEADREVGLDNDRLSDRFPLNVGEEYVIPRGVIHGGEVTAGTRTIHAFGGRRANRVPASRPALSSLTR